MIAFVLACMLHLAGGNPARLLALAAAIDGVVAERGPIFAGPDGERRTVALLVAIAYRESSFKLAAVGDGGRSVCAFQILDGPRSLLTDARACTDAGYTYLAASVRACPAHPVAPYARGLCPKAMSSTRAEEEARIISADRTRLARGLLGIVTPPPAKKETP